jgi:hypothetical protein
MPGGGGGAGGIPGGGGGGGGVPTTEVSPDLLRDEYKTWHELKLDLEKARELFRQTEPGRFGMQQGFRGDYMGLWARIGTWFDHGVEEFDAVGEALRQTSKDYYDTEIEAAAMSRTIVQEG